MTEAIDAVLVKMIGFLFGPIMLVVYFAVGIFFTIRLHGVQFAWFKTAFRECVLNIRGRTGKNETGQIQSFKALATALAGCVGNGNVAGVAYAIAVGGPGAVFWMWLAALFGMATKFAEITLAMHFREKDEDGNYRGGVMYILSRGMKHKKIGAVLGGAFAVFTIIVSLVSCGCLQGNTIQAALEIVTPINPWITMIICMAVDGLVIFGGLTRISDTMAYLTPFMALVYIFFCIIILGMHATQIPAAFAYIFRSAFQGDAIIGGVSGATMMIAMRQGVARGVFSNEAGTGSSAIVHATAKTNEPVRQSLYGIIEVFFDTIVVCTFTALVIMVTGVWNSGITNGTVLAANAFTGSLGTFGTWILIICLIMLCTSTFLGWSTYGEAAFAYLFGAHKVSIYRLIHMIIVGAGALISVQIMWDAADTANGLMALPNLFSLFLFSSVIVKDANDFFTRYKEEHKD